MYDKLSKAKFLRFCTLLFTLLQNLADDFCDDGDDEDDDEDIGDDFKEDESGGGSEIMSNDSQYTKQSICISFYVFRIHVLSFTSFSG